MRVRFRLLWVILLAGCRDSASSLVQGGQLEAQWTGSDTGSISAPAIAEWCEERRLLEIRAIRGDTGFALALSPNVVLSADTYRIVTPGESLVPSARLALRWFAPTAINGFQGDSGLLVLEQADSGKLTGLVEGSARSVSNSDRLTVSGAFRNLSVVPATSGCLPEPPADTSQDSEAFDTTEVD